MTYWVDEDNCDHYDSDTDTFVPIVTRFRLKPPMQRTLLLKLSLLLLFVPLLSSGCCLDPERWRTPNILHPGHIDVQRHNMYISDPLPATGIGLKNNGVRPRDADLPHDQFSAKSGIYDAHQPGLIQP